MIQAIRHFWNKFMHNEAYFIARVRSATAGLALCGGLFAHETAVSLSWPWIERPLKVAALLGVAVSFLMRAGDKNKPEAP